MADLSPGTEMIWVIMPDYGCEGLREPIMAFRDSRTAQAALDMIDKNPSATRMKLCSVPIWGETLQRTT